jgi:hypothetical protein
MKGSFNDTNIKNSTFDALQELKQHESMTTTDYNEVYMYDIMLNLCHTQPKCVDRSEEWTHYSSVVQGFGT